MGLVTRRGGRGSRPASARPPDLTRPRSLSFGPRSLAGNPSQQPARRQPCAFYCWAAAAAMQVKRPSAFCWGLPLRTGAIASGLLCAASAFVVVVVNLHNMTWELRRGRLLRYVDANGDVAVRVVVVSGYAIEALLSAAWCVLSAMLAYGVYRGKVKLVRPWVLFSTMFALAFIATDLLLIGALFVSGDLLLAFARTISLCVGIAAGSYLLLVVSGYGREQLEQPEQPGALAHA